MTNFRDTQSSRTAALAEQLKRIETELKALKHSFKELKKRAKNTHINAVSRQEDRKITDIRKRLGLK